MRGSWAGAMGQPQFLPSSFLKYAVDFDGTGRRDIWNSCRTASPRLPIIWRRRVGRAGATGFRGRDPVGRLLRPGRPDLARPIAEWAGMGIGRISGKAFPAAERAAAGMMLVPAGTHGPQFVVTPNFYVIKEYNNSDLYALYIGNLADRIASGGGAFRGRWGDVGGMFAIRCARNAEGAGRERLRRRKADGLPGYKTRALARRLAGEERPRADMLSGCFAESKSFGE